MWCVYCQSRGGHPPTPRDSTFLESGRDHGHLAPLCYIRSAYASPRGHPSNHREEILLPTNGEARGVCRLTQHAPPLVGWEGAHVRKRGGGGPPVETQTSVSQSAYLYRVRQGNNPCTDTTPRPCGLISSLHWRRCCYTVALYIGMYSVMRM